VGDPDPRGNFRRDEGKSVLQVFGFFPADRSQKFSTGGEILGEEVADLALREDVYGLLPYVKITDLLLEINRWTGLLGTSSI
jgi:hypothetical protein